MLDDQRRWRESREGQAWAAKRQQLPVVQIQAGLLAALSTQDLVVVGGDTGCGKTTQACFQISHKIFAEFKAEAGMPRSVLLQS